MKKLSIFVVSVMSLCVIFENGFAANAAPASSGNGNLPITIDTAQQYTDYLKEYTDQSFAGKTVKINVTAPSTCMGETEILHQYDGDSGDSLLTAEQGTVEWKFSVDTSGFYNLRVGYYPYEGKSATIMRNIYLDGTLPFEQARSVNFYRVWQDERDKNGNAIMQDKNGNDYLGQQNEVRSWQSITIWDTVGYQHEALKFYLSEGEHTLKFEAVQEPMLIREIVFEPGQDLPTYQELQESYRQKGYQSASADPIKIQAEHTSQKSDTMLVPSFDRSSSAIEPSDVVKMKLNIIGGTRWQSNGQWISWDFDVKEAGLYKIAIKAVQNVNSGGTSSRRIYIDGAVPCKELSEIAFPYSTSYKMKVLGEKNAPYEFYFEEGRHTIKMEVCLGAQSEIVQQVSEIVTELNTLYRQILIVTGVNPDQYRDYHFGTSMPEVVEGLGEQSKKLKECYDALTEINGTEGEGGQLLRQIQLQTEKMYTNHEKIATEFTSFQSNISALGTWITSARNQPLTLDYIIVAPPNAELPKATAGFFQDFLYQCGSFLSSFVNDYNLLSDSSDLVKNITIWVGSGMTGGRDQAQVLKNIAKNNFTVKTNIGVNLQLVSMDTLLPATMASRGPDVALSLSAADACNYAFRNAVADISKYDGFETVKDRFSVSALKPLQFMDGVYGLPETQTFPMLFYRKDILSELGVALPDTWSDVIALLPVLQKNQLNFGLPTASAVGSTITAYAMMLYQYGGELYYDNGTKSALDSDSSVEAFSFLTSLYRDYEIPLTIDFVNRFRSGEIPIAVADYSMYNQLSVFAPELNGLWDFTLVPGVKQADGSINRSVPGTVTASVIMQKSSNKQEAWDFLKWWTGADVQEKFGRELESVIGTAARYPTANLEALYQIPWSKSAFDQLLSQWKWVKGIPEVPGGYYTPRYLDFAFREAVYDSSCEPAEAITDAVQYIDVEISGKRKEFGLTN